MIGTNVKTKIAYLHNNQYKDYGRYFVMETLWQKPIILRWVCVRNLYRLLG